MNLFRFATCVVIVLGFITNSIEGLRAAEKSKEKPAAKAKSKPPAKPRPPKPSAKPHPTPHSSHPHAPAVTHAHSTLHRVHHNYYAGRAPRSLTWYAHHRHHRWVYEVRFRSRRWHERGFASHRAAHTFMRYLGYRHFQRHLYHPGAGVWLVTYRNPHSHHFGTYAALPTARRVEVALRERGFSAWIRGHRRYF